MGRPLRLLLIEDSALDEALLLRTLHAHGYDLSHRRVETLAGLNTALDDGSWEIIICDYKLSGFTAMEALELLRARRVEVPLILISSAVGEETAVAALKAGAHDFFLKHRLSRLGTAIERELGEAESRRARRLAEERLVESERQLRAALQARDEFVSIAAHEMRAPLAPLVLQLSAVLKTISDSRSGKAPLSVEKLEQNVRSSLRSVDRLTHLVQNLIQVSKIVSDTLVMSPLELDLRERVHDLAERWQAMIANSRSLVTITADSPVKGRWDPSAIESIIGNLLSNALKFGGAKPIEIKISSAEGTARLTVSDHGIGISPQATARIFEQFERAVPMRNYGGFGLGLWIVRRLVDALQGSIEVAASLGQGSTFSVALPLSGAPLVKEGEHPGAR